MSQTAQRTETPQNLGDFSIPPIIKRNTFFMAATQACVGIGTQLVPTLGAIIVVRLLGSATFAGIGTSLLGLSRFIVSYPMGIISDRYGRRPGMVIGLIVALFGALICGTSMVIRSFPVFFLGLLTFGMGMGAVQQLRVAAADMYPPTRRAEGLGYLLTGSFVGALGGPAVVSVANALAPQLGIDPLALAWMLVPAVLVPAILLVLQVRPDPKDIATNLERYYPGYKAPAPVPGASAAVGIRQFVRHYPKLTAFVTTFAVQGNMSMMMAMTAFTLDHHGHALPMISLAVSLHVMGMFGLSIPFGRLADRVGRKPLMQVGVVIAAAGSLLIVATPEYWVIALGTVLVGAGWSSASVAATALISDTCSPSERGRAIGASDPFAAASGIALPLLGGPIAEWLGLTAVGMFGASIMLVPLILQFRLKEPSPGTYE